MNKHVSDHLDQITLGEPQHYKNMQVIPMMLRIPGGMNYITLKKGLETEEVEITEVSEDGSVPHLAVNNKSDRPLLLIDGEEMVGAKQNRIVNTTMCLAPNSKTIIPVSCTEAGRWSYHRNRPQGRSADPDQWRNRDARKFSDSDLIMERKLRAGKSQRMSQNLKARRGYDAVQQRVWADINDFHMEHGSRSSTSAMKDAFDIKGNLMQKYLDHFPLVEGQCGSMVFINDEPAGFDLVSRASAYKQLHIKFMKSFAMDALVNLTKFDDADLQIEGYKFLHQIKDAAETQHKPVGLGTDLRYEKGNFFGSALVVEGDVLHLSGFNLPSPKKRQRPDFVDGDFDIV